MMTLEQAIQHAREVACAGGDCAFEHRQLVGWLEELQHRREADAQLTAGLYAIMSDWSDKIGGVAK